MIFYWLTRLLALFGVYGSTNDKNSTRGDTSDDPLTIMISYADTPENIATRSSRTGATVEVDVMPFLMSSSGDKNVKNAGGPFDKYYKALQELK